MSEYLIKEDVDNILKEYASKAWNDDWKPTHETVRGDTFIEASLIIDDMPTADAQPVKHGAWISYNWHEGIFDGWGIQCDQCLERYKHGLRKKNFCPNCGARMMKDGDTNG